VYVGTGGGEGGGPCCKVPQPAAEHIATTIPVHSHREAAFSPRGTPSPAFTRERKDSSLISAMLRLRSWRVPLFFRLNVGTNVGSANALSGMAFLARDGSLAAPPACPSRPSRGRRPRSPLRRYPSPFRDACPDRALPCCAPRRRGAAARWGRGKRRGRGVAAGGGGVSSEYVEFFPIVDVSSKVHITRR
jgi:hypothetical protein